MLHKAVRSDFIPFPYRTNQVNNICTGLYLNRIFAKTKAGISFVPLQQGNGKQLRKVLNFVAEGRQLPGMSDFSNMP